MYTLLLVTVLMIIVDFFILKKYIKFDNRKKFNVSCIVCCLINIVSCILLELKYGNIIYSHLMICFISLCSVLAVEDVVSLKIDKVISLILLAFGVVISFFVPDGSLGRIIIWSAIMFAIMKLFSIKSKESIGKGDVICITAATLCFTFDNVFAMMIYTLITSFIFGIIQVLLKKITSKQGIPFIPFLIIGIMMTITFI